MLSKNTSLVNTTESKFTYGTQISNDSLIGTCIKTKSILGDHIPWQVKQLFSCCIELQRI